MKMLSWSNPNYTSSAIIIDENFNVLYFSDPMFYQGELTDELKSEMYKFNIKGRIDKDHFLVTYPCSDEESIQRFLNNTVETRQITPELAIESYKKSVEKTELINKFLTPEKQQELIKLFNEKQ